MSKQKKTKHYIALIIAVRCSALCTQRKITHGVLYLKKKVLYFNVKIILREQKKAKKVKLNKHQCCIIIVSFSYLVYIF